MNSITLCASRRRGIARRHALRGVTLFELIVVMAIGGIMAAMALSSYKYVTTGNRISSEINGLLGDLQYARSEAIKEGAPVSVCISAGTPTPSCSTTLTDWKNGWLVFSDANGNGTVDSPPDAVLRAQAAFSGGDTFGNGALSVITFNREGFATGLGGSQMLTLHAPTPTSASTRCLALSMVGQTSVILYNGGTCS
jgi:type IV fimbrial biogenesis protein FimT